MKFRFFTNISHELRTPLTLIISPLEDLLKSTKDESQKSMTHAYIQKRTTPTDTCKPAT